MYKFLIISALITTTLSTTRDMNCLDMCRDKPLGYKLPDSTDCLGYILCHKDFIVQQYCASGTKFDEIKQECVVGKCPPCNCNCDSCSNSPTTETTTNITLDPELPTTTTNIPLEPEPPTTTTTNIPLDPESPSTTTPGGSSPDCSLYPNGTLLPDSVHCRFFWICLNSKAILRFCELGMWYDRVNFVCKYREMVDCPANQD